jgi:hypothetical protein
MWFDMPTQVVYHALEFDPDITAGGNTYIESLQCDFDDNGRANWRYFNSDVNQWMDFSPTVPCTLSPGSGWHHLQIWMTMDSGTYTYQSVLLDGTELLTSGSTTVPACSNTGYCANWADRIWVEQQLDNDAADSSSTEFAYYDLYTLTVW